LPPKGKVGAVLISWGQWCGKCRGRLFGKRGQGQANAQIYIPATCDAGCRGLGGARDFWVPALCESSRGRRPDAVRWWSLPLENSRATESRIFRGRMTDDLIAETGENPFASGRGSDNGRFGPIREPHKPLPQDCDRRLNVGCGGRRNRDARGKPRETHKRSVQVSTEQHLWARNTLRPDCACARAQKNRVSSAIAGDRSGLILTKEDNKERLAQEAV